VRADGLIKLNLLQVLKSLNLMESFFLRRKNSNTHWH